MYEVANNVGETAPTTCVLLEQFKQAAKIRQIFDPPPDETLARTIVRICMKILGVYRRPLPPTPLICAAC